MILIPKLLINFTYSSSAHVLPGVGTTPGIHAYLPSTAFTFSAPPHLSSASPKVPYVPVCGTGVLLFSNDKPEKLTDAPDDFSLDLYLLFQARVNGYKILEYPVHFGRRMHGDAKGGGTLKGKWKLIKRTWAYMNEMKIELKK